MSAGFCKCPKCGLHSNHNFRYLGPRESTSDGFIGECMIRECPHCGYKYTEPCADKERESS